MTMNFTEKATEGVRPSFAWRFGNALLGPTAHSELAIITDYDVEALVVTANCDFGEPEFRRHRIYGDHEGKYEIVFYEFKGLRFEQIQEVRTKCHEIVNKKIYRMSLLKMMASTFPSQFTRLYKWAMEATFPNLDDDNPLEYPPPHLPIYCVELIARVLNDTIMKDCPLPLDSYNASDLTIHLLRSGKITPVTTRPDKNPAADEEAMGGEQQLLTRSNRDGYYY